MANEEQEQKLWSAGRSTTPHVSGKDAKALADAAQETASRHAKKAFEKSTGKQPGGKTFPSKRDPEKVHERATVTIPGATDRGPSYSRMASTQHLPRKDWTNPLGVEDDEAARLQEDFTVTGSTSPEGGQTVAEAQSGSGRYVGPPDHWDRMKYKWTEKLTGTSHAPLELANIFHQLHDLQQKIPDLLDNQPELKADLEEYIRYSLQQRTTPGGESFSTQEELLKELEEDK